MASIEVNQPSSLPPYPEMIMKAIEALGDNGGNKSTISKCIKSTYGELAQEHSNLSSTILNSMKESGEIVCWKNNYMKPNPNGRSPKPKVLVPLSTILSPPRPRGRPPKDPNAPPKATSSKVSSGNGRPRGRPKKIARTGMASMPSSTRRPRGRPAKVRPQLEVSDEN